MEQREFSKEFSKEADLTPEMAKPRYAAIVLSAGSGRRMCSDVPKQYMDLCGYPVIYYSLKAFEKSEVDSVVLVTGEQDVAYCQEHLVKKYGFWKVKAVVAGGAERYLSVYEGLKAVDADYVLIHDGARPLISQKMIRQSMECVQQDDACVAAVPVKDTIKVADAYGYAESTPDRSRLWAVQTPQSFSCRLIKMAYEELFRRAAAMETVPPITDDAMIVEYATAHKVRLMEGDYTNIKITTPEDIGVAALFLKREHLE